MADFNVSLQAPQGAGANVVGVVNQQLSPWIGFAGELASEFMKDRKEKEEKERMANQQAIMSDFVREQTSLNDAMAQGRISQGQAAARARANFSKYAANFPGLVEEFSKQNKSLFENTGLGEAKEAEQALQDFERSKLTDLSRAGYVIPANASQTFIDAQYSAMQATRMADEQMQRTVRVNSELRAQAGEQRDVYNFKLKQETASTLAMLGGKHLDASYAFIEDLRNRRNRGEDPTALRNEAMAYFGRIQGGIAAAAAANPDMASNWNRLFQDVQDLAEKSTDPTTDADMWERQRKLIVNRTAVMQLENDPSLQALAGLSLTMQGNLPATFYEKNAAAVRALSTLAGNTDDSPQVVGTNKNGDAVGLIKNQISNIASGNAFKPEETKAQLSNANSKILRQIPDLLGKSTTVDDLRPTADYLASPEFLWMVNNTSVPREDMLNALDAMQILYSSDVSKAIENKLSGSISMTGDRNIKIGDSAEFVWKGTGVTVDMKNVGYLNPTARQDVAQWNKELKGATDNLNKLIRIGAHLEGHSNYEKYWENNKHRILPSVFPTPEGAEQPIPREPRAARPAASTSSGQWWKDF